MQSDTHPFDTIDGEIIDVDIVFKDRVDPSSFSAYIGCGTCGNSSAPALSPTMDNPMDVEPFTQTAYTSILSTQDRKFEATALRGCDSFTIHIVQHTTGAPIVWSAVVGLQESFTSIELLSFPIFILRNHGSAWNDLGFTIWVSIVAALLVINATRFALSRCGVKVFYPYTTKAKWREWLYEIALIAFATAAIEELIHLIYAQYGIPTSAGFWVGIIVVILMAQGVGVLFTVAVWKALRHPHWCSASPLWAPLEIGTGIAFLFWFGAGFFVAPLAFILAGSLRLAELYTHEPVPVSVVPAAADSEVSVQISTSDTARVSARQADRSSSLGFLSNR